MKGSKESQPPKFTPLAGVLPYEPQEVEIGGELDVALFESSHSDINPMIGSPPTVISVYVILKSVVSYHEKGSRSVPFAAAGISDSEIPLRFELDGLLLSLEDEVVLELDELDFELFF